MSIQRSINHVLREIRMKNRNKMVAEIERQQVEFTIIEHKALSDIAGFVCASQKMLVESMGRDKAQVARVIARLHRQDLIFKQEDPKDKRSVELSLSPKGERLLKSLDKVEMAMVDNMLSGFSKQDTDTFFLLLKRVNQNLS